jgi:hypothetical protein
MSDARYEVASRGNREVKELANSDALQVNGTKLRQRLGGGDASAGNLCVYVCVSTGGVSSVCNI